MSVPAPVPAESQASDVAVVIPARNEADRIEATVTAASGLASVGLVVVVDDGSTDGTGAVARRAGAVVLKHARNRGKAAAMQSGATAVGLVDQRERRERPRHLLFLDADLAESAAQAGPLADPVLAGTADMTIAVFAATVKLGGHGLVVGLSGAGIRRAAGPAAERAALPDPGGVRGGAPAGARLGGGDRAHHRPAAAGIPGHRGRGGARAPGHRHRPAGPAAPGAPAHRRGQGARRQTMIRRPERAAPAGSAEPAGSQGPASSRMPAGTAGLIAAGASVACTFAVAVAGPSVMEPVLPGRPGPPPWSAGLHPSPYLAVGLTGAGLAAGTLGLVLALRAVRGGWSVPARAVLVAGLLAAAALTLVPPFGSSDHLSYAAYGRMLVTGHNPYTTTPAQLAALGDPVARAVQDWSGSPSVYGPLATAIQALASLAGGTSVRLTVFVLGLANLAAFAGTALLLHWMTRQHPSRQLRAALLWAANPLLLQVLVAGAHVDSQAVVFGVAAVAVMSGGQAGAASARRAAMAGVLVGLGFAVKVTIALVGLGLAIAMILRLGRPGRPRPTS